VDRIAPSQGADRSSTLRRATIHAVLAKWLRHWTFNPDIAGSIPVHGTNTCVVRSTDRTGVFEAPNAGSIPARCAKHKRCLVREAERQSHRTQLDGVGQPSAVISVGWKFNGLNA
jgi:hypothetical protein